MKTIKQKVFNSAYTIFWINASVSLELAKRIETLPDDLPYRSEESRDTLAEGLRVSSVMNLWLHFESFINYLLATTNKNALAESRLPTLEKWLIFAEFEKQSTADKIKPSKEYCQMKKLKDVRNRLVHNRYAEYEYRVEISKNKRKATPLDVKQVSKHRIPKNPLDLKCDDVDKFFEYVGSFYKIVIKHTKSELLKREFEGRFVYGKVPMFHGTYYFPTIAEGLRYASRT
jgi:hypothetical protein